MTTLFHEGNRRLEDAFESRWLADRPEVLVRTAFSTDDEAFIESLPDCSLATADAEGRPNCLRSVPSPTPR